MNNRFGFWTLDQDNQLLHLRHTDQLRWSDIGKILFRSKTCCHLRYCQLVKSADRPRLFRRPQWTAEAEAELLKLRFTDKLTFREIARIIGRPTYAISEKLQRLNAVKRSRVRGSEFIKQFVPQSVLDERDARMNAEHSPIAALNGEPRPGQSALDRKLAGIADPPARDYRAEQLGPKPTLAGEML